MFILPHQFNFLIMENLTRDVMVGMLRQGQNGDQFLQILDVVTSNLNVNKDEDVAVDAELVSAI